MNETHEHLTDEQLHALLDAQLLRDEGAVLSPAYADARRHLDLCADCGRMFHQLESVSRRLASLKGPSGARPEGNCPGEADLRRLSVQELPADVAGELMRHVTSCDHCAATLREAAEDLVFEPTAAEQQAVERLDSSNAEWQARLAGRLAQTRPGGPSSTIKAFPQILRWNRMRWLLAAAAASAILLVGATASLLIWRSRPGYANALLAEAYSQRRTLEVRIPGADYAPMRVERGTGPSSLDKPTSLLKAEVLIAEKLSNNPSDPAWLQAKARADLLESNFESAIKSLQRALETQPNSPSLLTDLGSAYFLRALSSDRPIDYGNAIESLGKALAKSPNDPIALFNRALACERMFLYTQAIDDWEHYLRVAPKGAWADDARKHLSALKGKVENRRKGFTEPLLAPREIALEANGSSITKKIEGRLEDYLYAAVADWLPAAYPAVTHNAADTDEFRKALSIVASTAAQNHQDQWLTDLLLSASSPSFPQAVSQLSDAVRSNDAGDNEAARRAASAAERLFVAAGQNAGALRAQVEYVFASHDAQEGDECMLAASGVGRQLALYPYPWLQTQFAVEHGTCFWFVGNLSAARESYEQAERVAQASGYPVLLLRTQDHLAALGTDAGDFAASAARTQMALSNFWSGQYPPMRGYNLYFNTYECSRLTNRPHLQLAAWRDGLELSEFFRDNVLRAMAHSDMADAALAAGMPALAERELATARDIFAASPQIRSVQTAGIEAETRLAAVETSQGRAQEAVSLLRPFVTRVSELSDAMLQILFFTTMGDADSRIGLEQEAGSYLRSAVGLAELQLRSLRGDKARIDWEKRTSNAYRNLAQLQIRQGAAESALETWEFFRGSALRAGSVNGSTNSAPASLPELREVAARLPVLKGETIISYALLPRGLAIWGYDNRGVFTHWKEETGSDLEGSVQRFRDLCSDPNSDLSTLRRRARSLYDVLVGPIEDRLSPDRVLVVELDDHLSGLPFEALVDQQDRYLGERVPVLLSLGLYYQGDNRVSSQITDDTPALIAGVSSSSAAEESSLSPLPDAGSESEMVARGFRSSQLFLARAATASAILSRLPSAAVFHFAGHTLSSPQKSGLLLSDAFLTAQTLQTVSLSRLRLAVFSACATQNGSEGAVYDSDSLVRTFLRAGVPHVVASRWNVDSAATRKFMEHFYRALLNGSSPTEATRVAQSSLRSMPATRHPYFWSAFGSFGLV